MAIAYDNSVSGRILDAGTQSFTIANEAILFVVTDQQTTAVTYNSVSLTLWDSYNPNIDSNSVLIKVWKLENPTSGTHNLAFTLTSIFVASSFCAVSYTGVSTSQPEAYVEDKSYTTGPPPASTQVASFTSSVTTLSDKAWAVMFICGGNNVPRNFTAGSGTTHRASHGSLDTNSTGILDSGGAVTPAGSKSLTADWSSGTGFVSTVTVSLAPSQALLGTMIIL